MIRLQNVTKFYQTALGRHYVFRNVSMEIPSNVNVGVIGKNGAGKTTLLRLLSGADVPNEGRITRTGNISWALGITSGIQTALTGAENARFACRIQGVPVADIPKKLAEIETFAEIGKFYRLPVYTYSSGMKGRLKFGIAMAFDFDVYLIDELTAVGDASFKAKAKSIFKAKRDRASFIKCTHNLQELVADCDAGILLDDGELTYHSNIKDAVKAYLQIVHKEKTGATVRGRGEPIKARGVSVDGEGQSRRGAGRRRGRGRRAPNSTTEPVPVPMTREAHTPAPMAPRITTPKIEKQSPLRSFLKETS